MMIETLAAQRAAVLAEMQSRFDVAKIAGMKPPYGRALDRTIARQMGEAGAVSRSRNGSA